jgi:hypothetical protein
MRISASIGLLLALLSPAAAERPGAGVRAGDIHEITLTRDYSGETGEPGESSSSSFDRDSILERVIAVRPDGLELEYDLPKTEPAEPRADNWQFPARVFRPDAGAWQLLNRAELEARLEAWLKKAKFNRAACGHWIFTWNAFRIECDPQSAIEIAQAFDLGPAGLSDGASYPLVGTRGPAILARTASGPEGSTFTTRVELDPEWIRRERAENDVVAAEIMGKPVAFVTAASKYADDAIAGTVSVSLETDSAGRPVRRTKVSKLKIRRPDGVVEKSTTTEILERHAVPGPVA